VDDLVHLRRPVADLRAELAAFPWDSWEDLSTITVDVVRSLLDRYLAEDGDDAIDQDELEAWAEAVEVRDDVGFQAGAEDLLKDFVFELANAAITRRLTEEVAWEWLSRIPRAIGPSGWDTLDLDGLVDRAARRLVDRVDREQITYDALRPTMRLVVRNDCVVFECHHTGGDLFLYPVVPEDVESAIDQQMDDLVLTLQHEADTHEGR
jgi:hypothetical protein